MLGNWEVMKEEIEQGWGEDRSLWDAVFHLPCLGFGVVVHEAGLSAGQEIGQPLLEVGVDAGCKDL